MTEKNKKFPRQGIDHRKILELVKRRNTQNMKWEEGKVFGYVYHPGKEYEEIIQTIHNLYFYENALSPSLFPSILEMENEIVAMVADLLHGDTASGNVTSGGTESIMLAVKSAKRLGESKKEITKPEMIIPVTGHPAFMKAADYLDIRVKVVPVANDKRVTVDDINKEISEDTILIVASAPNFPYGVIDPLEEIGKLAAQHEICFHVDGCLGAFMLPFLEDAGHTIPLFDFRIPGVTSISADLHKFGYAPKGTSVILYRDSDLRKHQFFVYADWPGGIYASPTLSGSKGAGAIAGAWALINILGFDGYLSIAKRVMETTEKIKEGIEANPDLQIISNPEMSNLAFISQTANILLVGDEMSKRGWHLDRLQFPNALHINITQLNIGKEEEFIDDLKESINASKRINWENISSKVAVSALKGISKVLPSEMVKKWMTSNVSKPGEKQGIDSTQKSVMYGIAGSMGNREDMREIIIEMLAKMYKN